MGLPAKWIDEQFELRKSSSKPLRHSWKDVANPAMPVFTADYRLRQREGFGIFARSFVTAESFQEGSR